MSKLSVILIGVICITALFVILIWINIAVPSSKLVNDRFVPIPEVLQDGRDFTKAVQGLEKHGNVPITIQEGDKGRSNPFAQ